MKTQWEKGSYGMRTWQWSPSRETAKGTGGGCELYGTRERNGEWGLLRAGVHARYNARCVLGATVGLHVNQTNYGFRTAGWEWFGMAHAWCVSVNVHAGWLRGELAGSPRMKYSGSMREPYTAVTVRVWRVFVGCELPKWVQKRITDRENARMEKAYADWVAAHPEEWGNPADEENY